MAKPPADEPKRTYLHFARCPRCKSLNTRQTHTSQTKQYRICLRCERGFCVRGYLV